MTWDAYGTNEQLKYLIYMLLQNTARRVNELYRLPSESITHRDLKGSTCLWKKICSVGVDRKAQLLTEPQSPESSLQVVRHSINANEGEL
jgi:hypothetical protein